MSRVPILRVAAGLLFISAGILYYRHFTIDLTFPIILVVAGAAVVLLAATRQRVHGWDVILFIVGLMALGSVSPGYSLVPSQTVSYMGSRSAVNVSSIDVIANVGLGSVKVSFSNTSNLAYQVDFKNPVAFPFIPLGKVVNSFSNQTRGGVLYLNTTSSSSSLVVTLGRGYKTNISATTGTGSVDLSVPAGVTLENVMISTGTGSIDAMVGSTTVSSLRLRTGTGSVHFTSGILAPSGARVRIAISTGTGSVDVNAKIAGDATATLTASTGLGSIKQGLQGFTISQSSSTNLQATAGDPTAKNSFIVSVTTATGSIELSISR